ncbi:MAG TPA: 4-(cytidine 5'-diphospho)-2-C-methyl-D-erythritol kinase [Nevskiales bacterium]|nr:4-(cytidine 5'-diphospho)-2-C-methyl-D-erythritol kinase [Nevskiales bacterium]
MAASRVGAFSADAAWPAPAKLNLFLHVTGRRADGYHTLQTVFQFLEHGDSLGFELRSDARVRRVSGPAALDAESDLVVRAARLLQQAGGVRQGADIHLDKRLPLGSGLGGGSSDAATTLVALNRLWGLDWPPARLAELGLQLGADVPVFVHGHAAWAEGVGELLTPVELPAPFYLVITPACQVSTAEIFNAPELKRNSTPIKMPQFLSGMARNDCWPVVRERYPQVAQAFDFLAEHAQARLTGTGASVFAAFASRAAARAVQDRVPQGWQSFVARGLNRSPLLARAGWG